MVPAQLETWILKHFDGLVVTNAYRERSFFYNPNGDLPKGIYFCTIKESDGPNDKAANLNREGVFRLSLGIGKKKYQELFGETPARPAKGEVVDLDLDFTVLDELLPHPVYAWMGWVCMNNPTRKKLDQIQSLMLIAYKTVQKKWDKRTQG